MATIDLFALLANVQDRIDCKRRRQPVGQRAAKLAEKGFKMRIGLYGPIEKVDDEAITVDG